MTQPITSKLLTLKEVAAKLAISSRSAWSLTNAGKIPAVRIGRSVRYTEQAINDFIQSNETGGSK